MQWKTAQLDKEISFYKRPCSPKSGVKKKSTLSLVTAMDNFG